MMSQELRLIHFLIRIVGPFTGVLALILMTFHRLSLTEHFQVWVHSFDILEFHSIELVSIVQIVAVGALVIRDIVATRWSRNFFKQFHWLEAARDSVLIVLQLRDSLEVSLPFKWVFCVFHHLWLACARGCPEFKLSNAKELSRLDLVRFSTS